MSRLLLLLFCFMLSSIHLQASTQFDFGTLTLNSLKLLGDAHLSNGSIRLTKDLAVPNSGAGRVLYGKPISFRQPTTNTPVSFSTMFSFSVSNLNPSSIGGGLAFVITPDSNSIGSAGGSLGLVGEDIVIGSGFVAVEFDTLMDVEFKDINGNHVGLDLNNMVSSQVADLGAVNIELRSGDLVTSWIDFDGSTRIFNISVSYSNLKPEIPLLSFTLDLDQYVDDFMYVGFSGSTQGSTEIHSIEWWSFSSSFDSGSQAPSTAILTNQTANSVKSPPPTASLGPTESNPISTTQRSSDKSSSCHNELCKKGPGVVAGVVTAGAFFFAFFAVAFIWVYKKKFKHVKKSESFASDIIKMPKEFSYKELRTATKCFNANRVIGQGAFGTVYKGILTDNGDIVAVKRCNHTTQGKTEFFSELSIIGTLRHRNLVRLQGWCHEKGEILLVYDLMPNGSLDKVLFEARTPLPWHHRRKILLGVASALAYLHQECENQVIHRDVKTSNIMLDEGFNARLGDFACSHPDPLARPTMRGVVQMLVGDTEVPIVPKAKPSMSFSTSHLLLSLQDSLSDCNGGMINLSSSSSENSYVGDDLV
ncbi:hypothetical protein ACFE04_001723 [Oxalis oulophora]